MFHDGVNVPTTTTYECWRCGTKKDHTPKSPLQREDQPPGWVVVTVSGSPILTRRVCPACRARVIHTLNGVPEDAELDPAVL